MVLLANSAKYKKKNSANLTQNLTGNKKRMTIFQCVCEASLALTPKPEKVSIRQISGQSPS